ncbi:hypothetical protein AX774_g2803 [Zancudomyces culisetae]|uniref:Uncharacterized protein n=1 Tax=Zancudomyces culisetae TaxID=1213189 RepID=A0A1R1PRS8_ZANCU|nr:hypothetical protein AX774_g2803 [Zancudomyces culisetae]|eukprot:OMH83685.1 hypothetical protein AX774_g2803 [Zancudomyces culisetae]
MFSGLRRTEQGNMSENIGTREFGRTFLDVADLFQVVSDTVRSVGSSWIQNSSNLPNATNPDGSMESSQDTTNTTQLAHRAEPTSAAAPAEEIANDARVLQNILPQMTQVLMLVSNLLINQENQQRQERATSRQNTNTTTTRSSDNNTTNTNTNTSTNTNTNTNNNNNSNNNSSTSINGSDTAGGNINRTSESTSSSHTMRIINNGVTQTIIYDVPATTPQQSQSQQPQQSQPQQPQQPQSQSQPQQPQQTFIHPSMPLPSFTSLFSTPGFPSQNSSNPISDVMRRALNHHFSIVAQHQQQFEQRQQQQQQQPQPQPQQETVVPSSTIINPPSTFSTSTSSSPSISASDIHLRNRARLRNINLPSEPPLHPNSFFRTTVSSSSTTSNPPTDNSTSVPANTGNSPPNNNDNVTSNTSAPIPAQPDTSTTTTTNVNLPGSRSSSPSNKRSRLD